MTHFDVIWCGRERCLRAAKLASCCELPQGAMPRNVPGLSTPIQPVQVWILLTSAAANLKNQILQFCFAQNLEEFLEASL